MSAFYTAVAPSFDSGLADPGAGGINTFVNVPNCPTGAIGIGGMFFNNTSGVQVTVSVKDANGVALVSAMPIPANTPVPIGDFNLMPAVGPLQWSCSVATGVNAKIWGWS